MKTFRIAPEIILYDYAEEKTMPKFMISPLHKIIYSIFSA